MTQEDKAKAYDKALDLMKDCVLDKDGYVHVRPEDIFSELAESEDEKNERIRLGLIEVLKTVPSGIFEDRGGITLDEGFYWLERKEYEKQGEQKPTAEEVLIKAGLKPYKDGNQWCILVGDNIQEGICGFGDTIEDALYDFLKEVCQQKQKSVEEVNGEDYGIDGLWHAITILEQTLGEVEGYQSDDGILEHKCAITAVRDLAKKQKEPKQEWSEEDEEMISDCCAAIGDAKYFEEEDKDEMIKWLKSLRPQKQWKPSDKQIMALRWVLNNIPYNTHKEEISWLLEQVQNL